MSDRALKTGNYAVVGVYMSGILALGYAVLFQISPGDAGVASISTALSAAAAAVLAAVVVELLGSEAKARLIYCRWRQALPGYRAFTVHIHEDGLGRINMKALAARYGALPSDPKAQNAMWYGMLLKNGDAAPVAHAHQRYLLFRDLTWVTLILFVAAIGVSIRLGIESPPRLAFLGALFALLMLLWIAAARFGFNLVKTVLAVESHREDK